MSRLVAVVPQALALAGISAMLVGTHGAAWPLALGWTVLVIIFSLLWRRPLGRFTRAVVGLGTAAALVLLTWEGGLFLIPALIAAVILPPGRRIGLYAS